MATAALAGAAVRPSTAGQAGSFHPVDATRVLDTRTGPGLAAAQQRRVRVAGDGPVPAGAAAVAVNVTVLTPARSGSVSVFPNAWNGAASISFIAGQTKQSMIIAVLAGDGSLAVRNNTGATLQVIGDVVGYYAGGTAAGPGMFHPLGLSRVYDTRAAGGHPLAAGSTTLMPVAGHGGVPASGAAGVVANLTVIAPARSGSVSTYASGTNWDGSASESFAAGRSEQDVLSISLGPDGAAMIRNNSPASVQVVVDVIGFYLAGSPTDYGSYQPVALARAYDSRNQYEQPVPARQTITVTPANTLSSPSPVPQWGVPAVLARVSVLSPSVAGSLSVFRGDQAWNGAASISFPAGTSTQQQLLAPLGPDGRLQLRNNTGKPLSVVVDMLGYYLGQPSPVHVTSQQEIDPQRGNPSDISCPTLTFCISVQIGGYFETWNGSDWTAPQRVTPAYRLFGISCLSATSCVAVGQSDGADHDAIFGYDGSQWTTGPSLINSGYAGYVSCAASGFCMAEGGVSYRTFNGSSWSAEQPLPDYFLYPLTCTSASWCIAPGDLGQIFTYDGTSWSAPQKIAGITVFSATCTSGTFCIATGVNNTALYDGTQWTVSGPLANGLRPGSVSCISDTDCQVLTSSGSVLTFDGHSWSSPVGVDPTMRSGGRIRCSTAGSCAVLDTTAQATAVVFYGASWGSPRRLDFPPGPLTDVSCSSASFCMAVDYGGYALRYDGSSWATPVQLTGGVALLRVSCTSTNRCVAVDVNGEAVSYDGTGWSAPVVADAGRPLQGLSCVGPTFCAAFDASDQAVTFDGSNWSAPTALGSSSIRKLSCATTTFCLAVGDHGSAVFDGSGWTTGPAPGNRPRGLSCPAAGFCLETGSSTPEASPTGGVARWDNGRWTPVEALSDTFWSGNLSCAGAQTCLVMAQVDQRGIAVGWNAAGWTMPVAPATMLTTGTPVGSCPSSTFCMVLDGKATAYRLDG